MAQLDSSGSLRITSVISPDAAARRQHRGLARRFRDVEAAGSSPASPTCQHLAGWRSGVLAGLISLEIGGSSPPPATKSERTNLPVAQMDSAPDYGSGGCRFESCQGGCVRTQTVRGLDVAQVVADSTPVAHPARSAHLAERS